MNTGQIIQIGTKPGASKQDLRRVYLARILNQANHLPLFSGDRNSAQVRLSSVYTALLTHRGEGDARAGYLFREPERSSEHDKKLSALDVLNGEKKLVLLGGPGSGKSTFVNFVALCMAGELLGADAINLENLCAPIPSETYEESEVQHWNHGALLPVPVILRDFASELPAPGKPVELGDYRPGCGFKGFLVDQPRLECALELLEGVGFFFLHSGLRLIRIVVAAIAQIF